MDNDLLKIMIVDDDEVDRMVVHRAIHKAEIQAEIYEVEDCASAMSALRSQPFDCVFSDYRLPDRDGLALVQMMRQEALLTPIIVLTGQGDEQIAVDLMKAGASDYLNKSKISPSRIAQMLRNAVRVYKAEAAAQLATQRLQESYNLLVEQHRTLEQQRQQIYEQNLQLIQSAALKSQFLATISHELRTPLNAIIGFSQMLLRPSKGTLNQKQIDMVQRIFSNGNNLLEMLTEVLDFSRIEANRFELKSESFNLEDLINATADEVRSLAMLKQLTLSTHINLQNAVIFNDIVRLRQALSNLLSNAIKFTETGQVWIEAKEILPDRLSITVHDTGIGIAPEHIASVFEAFRQVDQTKTRTHPGTGLGLAIAQNLVQMMGGTLRVTSQVGQGSVFKIEIPRYVEGSSNRSKSILEERA
jgi:signal transduction histidine kinase